MAKPTGPSEIQPDPWEPDAEISALAQTFAETATISLPASTGETFHACRLCGQVDSHDETCPLPALRRWLDA